MGLCHGSLVKRDWKQLAVSFLGFLPGYLSPFASGSAPLSLDGVTLRRGLDESAAVCVKADRPTCRVM